MESIMAKGGGTNNRFRRWALWMLSLSTASLLVQGCISNKKLVYLQDPTLMQNEIRQIENIKPVYILQTGDVVSVQVRSTDQEVNGMFSANPAGSFTPFADPASLFLQGYTIDEAGDINLPTAGKLKMKGLTLPEANKMVQTKVGQYLREAVVTVKMVSFKITILGEVKRPGYFYVNNLQCTLLEGLGLGGDLTNIGNRARIKLIRQTTKGSEVAMLNLTDANLIKSPYYYLQPNDVIYVEPLSGQTPRANLAPVTLTLGILSTLITTAILIVGLRRD